MNPEDLVREYTRRRDPKLREQVIIQFLPLVRFVLGRMQLPRRSKTEFEDIHSAGILGLIQAFDDFDISKKTKFKTYATFRIRGHILDYLRKIDFISRSDRAKIRAIERTLSQLTKQLAREPSDAEVVAELGLDLDEYHRLMELVQLNFTITFDQKQNINDEEVRLSEVIADNSYEGPLEQFSKKDMFNLVKEAIRNLPEREKLIVIMYYSDEMTQLEIAKVLDLSESRVCRLLGKALLKIRNEVNEVKNQTEVPI